MAAGLASTPQLNRIPALAAVLVSTRTRFGIWWGHKSVLAGVSRDNGESDSLSRRVFSRSISRRAEEKRGVCRSARESLEFREQGGREEEGFGGTNSNYRRLILYSKPGCCLCDGLKEKLEGSETFPDIHLEIRDITTNSEWWNSYQYEIPVLVRVRDDGTEEPLPRLSPRLSAEQVQKKIHALMTSIV